MDTRISSPFKVTILENVQILVVDNDVDSGLLYSIFLTGFGANVMVSSSIKGALEILHWFVPNIIICEIRFLGESVSKLFNKLSLMATNNMNDIPIIVTSTCNTSLIKEITDIEVERYLLKPFDIDHLMIMVVNLLWTSKIIDQIVEKDVLLVQI
ncbi:response regulator [Anabaena sp. UHCC 0253]|uniref:response regulator n=1 Tax=Anabaena sp. UHCC 0253 TaxID=2590019 RepID=UPI00144805FD|nr:response regulator [Anabaena sp. UHCC 0253]MTJ51663.1 response regulator [Anabaena sp. UHCC 0253]